MLLAQPLLPPCTHAHLAAEANVVNVAVDSLDFHMYTEKIRQI